MGGTVEQKKATPWGGTSQASPILFQASDPNQVKNQKRTSFRQKGCLAVTERHEPRLRVL
jgi:hypothetical protein